MPRSRSLPLALLLAALAAAPAHAAPAAHAPGVDARWAVAEDGVRIAYETEGDSTAVPIVLVAGGPGSSHHGFHLTHRRLAALGRVVYFDNRGRGRSDPGVGPVPYSIDRDVADVEAVRRALGAERIVLYGRSYGGMVAQAYAIAHPERVRALILSNTLDGARAWQAEYIDGTHAFLARQFPERWERIVRLHDQRTPAAAETLSTLFGPLAEMYHYDLGNDSTYRAGMQAVSERGVPIHAPAVYRAMIGADPEWTIDGTLAGIELLPRLGEVTAPVLVVAGRYDRICPPSAARRIAGALKDARLVVFERSGHRPELEQADAWYAAIEEFLRGRLGPEAPAGAR